MTTEARIPGVQNPHCNAPCRRKRPQRIKPSVCSQPFDGRNLRTLGLNRQRRAGTCQPPVQNDRAAPQRRARIRHASHRGAIHDGESRPARCAIGEALWTLPFTSWQLTRTLSPGLTVSCRRPRQTQTAGRACPNARRDAVDSRRTHDDRSSAREQGRALQKPHRRNWQLKTPCPVAPMVCLRPRRVRNHSAIPKSDGATHAAAATIAKSPCRSLISSKATRTPGIAAGQ